MIYGSRRISRASVIAQPDKTRIAEVAPGVQSLTRSERELWLQSDRVRGRVKNIPPTASRNLGWRCGFAASVVFDRIADGRILGISIRLLVNVGKCIGFWQHQRPYFVTN